MGTRIIKLLMPLLLLAGSACADIVRSDLKPYTDNAYDLGTSTKQWQDLYLSGTLYFDGSAVGMYKNLVIMGNTGNGTWKVYEPNGAEVVTTSSTTDGLAEAFTAAVRERADLYVYGGGKGPGVSDDYATITCTTTVTVPPLEGAVVRFDGVRITWPLVSIGANSGMVIDSCMLSSFYFEGEFIYYGTGNALEFTPTSELYTDASGPGIIANHFSFNAIGSAGDKCVEFNKTGGIACNTFEFLEMNMDSAPVTAQFITSDANSSCNFAQNIITARFLHGCTNTTDATIDIRGGYYSYANNWDLSFGEPNEGTGLQTDSRNDIYILDITPAGNTLTGVVFDTNATQNEVTIQRFADAAYGTLYTDNSTAQDNLVRWGNNIATPLRLRNTLIRTSQEYVQSIADCKVGTAAGWVVRAADNVSLVTLPQSQTGSTLIIPITIPLKIGYTITGFRLNGQIDSGGNGVTVDADLRKHTEATAGYADASIGTITQISKTGDYKIIDSKTSLAEVVAADESYYIKITATTGATCDVEIASVTLTVSEL